MLRLASANLFLQGLTLAAKALLLLLMARYLTPAEVGVFGILLVTLGLALYGVGLDFYAYNMREILARDRSAAPRLIRDQAVFHGLAYLIVLPALLPLFTAGVLPWRLAGVFYALLVLEHLSYELQRLLLTLSRPVLAAAVLFVRGGAWVLVLWTLWLVEPATRTLEVVAYAWIFGAAAGIALALHGLSDLPWLGVWSAPVDWPWIRRGLAVAAPFLVSTLALRGIVSVDRYVLQAFRGEEAVGVYTFYMSIRNAVQGFLDMGVLFILRPRIVEAYQKGNLDRYRALLRRLTGALVGLGLLLAAGAWLFIGPVLALVDRPIYGEHLGAYGLLLVMALAAALADIPHTALYARHRDRAIILASLAGLGVAVAANLLLVPEYGLLGAAGATLLATATVGGAKVWAARRPDRPEHGKTSRDS